MTFEETKGRFGFHLNGGIGGPQAKDAFVQFYVKSSALSRHADLAISPRLTTVAEIDRFIDEAIAALQAIRIDAKSGLGAANLA
jgi:hypothetical protein